MTDFMTWGDVWKILVLVGAGAFTIMGSLCLWIYGMFVQMDRDHKLSLQRIASDGIARSTTRRAAQRLHTGPDE